MTGLMVLLALLAAEVPNGRPVGESPSFSFVDSTSQTVVRALEAAMLLSDQEGGDLRLAVWSGQFEGPGGEPGVLMVVEVDGPALLSGAVSDDLIVDLHVYALKEEHQIDAAISRRVDIELKEHRRLLETGGLKLPVFLPLPAGNHHLRLLATTGPESFGVRSLQVSVIADSSAEPSARPPVFPDRSDGWLVALPAVQGEGETDPWPPFLSRQSETLPSALPVLHRGERPRGFVYVPSSNRLDRLQVVLRPSFADTVVRLSVAPLRRRQSGSPHLEIVEFELPEIDLPSGIYTGIVELEPEMEDGPSTKSFNLVVSDLVEALHWPQLDLETGSPPDEEAVAAISLQPATGLPQREIVEGYRLVVLRLAEGHEEEALELLSTLEQQSLRPGEQASMSRLETSQERVSQSLSNQGVELLPLLLLHTRAALNYRTRGQFVLSRHSLRLVRHLARFTDPTAEHSEAAPATAGLLIMLADSEAESATFHRPCPSMEKRWIWDGTSPVANWGLPRFSNARGAMLRRSRSCDSCCRANRTTRRPGFVWASTWLARISSSERNRFWSSWRQKTAPPGSRVSPVRNWRDSRRVSAGRRTPWRSCRRGWRKRRETSPYGFSWRTCTTRTVPRAGLVSSWANYPRG